MPDLGWMGGVVVTEVPTRRTSMTPPIAVGHIADAYRTALGRVPKPKTLAILVAQSALETGQWKSMWLYNFGNMRAGRNYGGKTQSLKGADEIINGKRVTGAAVEAGFRAYDSAHEGALDFVRFLMVDTTPNNGRPNKWEVAAEAAERGDLKTYVFALSDPDGNPGTSDGYFTADPDIYYDGLRALYEQMLPLCSAHLGVRDTDPTELDPHNFCDIITRLRVVEKEIGEATAMLGSTADALARRAG